jgi:hypothetical protein
MIFMLDTNNSLPALLSLPLDSSSWLESDIPGQKQSEPHPFSEYIVDVLGVSAWDETYNQTTGYRWKGKDTLTWGNLDEWVSINRIRELVRSSQKNTRTLIAETELRAVLIGTRIVKLDRIYSFRMPDEIKSFLLVHPTIISVLDEARSVLEKFFGESVRVSLEIISDPEASDHRQLFGYINAELSPEDALSRLDAFDNAWFLKQLNLVGGLFNFNLE